MHQGGSNVDGTDLGSEGTAAGPGSEGRLRRTKVRLLVASGAALVVLAAAVTIPWVLVNSDTEQCYELPASTRALADDPQKATEALDPGADLGRIEESKQLLRHPRVCGDGGGVLGRIVQVATVASGPGKPHSMEQARAAYAVAAAVHDLELPRGLAVGVARVVADYVVDAGRDHFWGRRDEAPGPAASPESARPDGEGRVGFGRFLAPGEAHTVFEYVDRSRDADADMESLVAELSKDPEAFAVLYEAERANFAHYLERLTRNGADPGFKPPPGEDSLSVVTAGPDNDLRGIAGRIGRLMQLRGEYAQDRTIEDLPAFDRAVREHTRGTFRTAASQQDSRPVMGDIADRPVSGPVEGDLMDGRHQLFSMLDVWVKERRVPTERAAAMKQLLDDAYVRGLWLRR
jgi:hypothetical protein